MNRAQDIRGKFDFLDLCIVLDAAFHNTLLVRYGNEVLRQVECITNPENFPDRLLHTPEMFGNMDETTVVYFYGFYEKRCIHEDRDIGRYIFCKISRYSSSGLLCAVIPPPLLK